MTETGRREPDGAAAGGGRGPFGSESLWCSRSGRIVLGAGALGPAVAVFALAPASPWLLVGVVAGVLVATFGLHLQGRSWRAAGLRPPVRPGRLAVLVAGSVGVLVLATRLLRPLVRDLTGRAADLSAFEALEGDPVSLLAGLAVAWTVAAFGEELLFRGFLLNLVREMVPPEGDRGGARSWGVALVVTSVLSGPGHAYQGPTGMILTGILALGFGIAYLVAGRNLWAAILTHGLYDTIGFVLLFLGAGSGGTP